MVNINDVHEVFFIIRKDQLEPLEADYKAHKERIFNELINSLPELPTFIGILNQESYYLPMHLVSGFIFANTVNKTQLQGLQLTQTPEYIEATPNKTKQGKEIKRRLKDFEAFLSKQDPLTFDYFIINKIIGHKYRINCYGKYGKQWKGARIEAADFGLYLYVPTFKGQKNFPNLDDYRPF